MKKVKLFAGLLLVCLMTSFNLAQANTEAVPTLYEGANLSLIKLEGSGNKVEWSVEGRSEKGFKVVWSKTSGATYPTREGDQYQYFSNPETRAAELNAFSGDGEYFVRVCEYLGGTCGVYSNEIKLQLGNIEETKACTMEYAPVCGLLQVQCIKAPCEPIKKTYGNNCQMNAAGAKFLKSGECEVKENAETVTSIKLSGEENKVEWSVEGYSKNGYKVVWSKTAEPTYPTREGDMYLYFASPKQDKAAIKPFGGTGTYYVRVCEYLGGKCGVYSNEIKLDLKDASVNFKDQVSDKEMVCGNEYEPVCGKDGNTYTNKCIAKYQYGVKTFQYGECKKENEYEKSFRFSVWICGDGFKTTNQDETSCKTESIWKKYAQEACAEKGGVKTFAVEKKCESDVDSMKIKNKAKDMADDNFENILGDLNELQNNSKEQAIGLKFLNKLKDKVQALTSKIEEAINKFITYGSDENSKKLGEGERAGVMFSYKKAFGKLPETEGEFEDVIRIANGRWPNERNEVAENSAKEKFEKIYKRIPDMNDKKDNAAVTVMTYGLRQKAENRNLESEKKGIETFKKIFGKTPTETEEWDTVQTITYSGATREADADKDLLSDRREAELGTDPKNPDTDGDGYIDGEEVANGYDPLNK